MLNRWIQRAYIGLALFGGMRTHHFEKSGLVPQFPLEAGGRYRDRTCDPYHVKVVLYR